MLSKFAKAVGFVAGIAAIIWAMRDRFISVAVSREPQPPAFESHRPTSPSRDDRGLETIDGIGPTYSSRLEEAGIRTRSDLAKTALARIAEAAGVSETRASSWLDQVRP